MQQRGDIAFPVDKQRNLNNAEQPIATRRHRTRKTLGKTRVQIHKNRYFALGKAKKIKHKPKQNNKAQNQLIHIWKCVSFSLLSICRANLFRYTFTCSLDQVRPVMVWCGVASSWVCIAHVLVQSFSRFFCGGDFGLAFLQNVYNFSAQLCFAFSIVYSMRLRKCFNMRKSKLRRLIPIVATVIVRFLDTVL